MKHVKAIAIKTVVIALLSWVVLSLFSEVPHGQSILIGILISLIIYVLGDLVVLRKIGNVVATVVDMGDAFLVAWAYLTLILNENLILESFILATLIAVFEWFFHDWLLKHHVVPDERSTR